MSDPFSAKQKPSRFGFIRSGRRNAVFIAVDAIRLLGIMASSALIPTTVYEIKSGGANVACHVSFADTLFFGTRTIDNVKFFFILNGAEEFGFRVRAVFVLTATVCLFKKNTFWTGVRFYAVAAIVSFLYLSLYTISVDSAAESGNLTHSCYCFLNAAVFVVLAGAQYALRRYVPDDDKITEAGKKPARKS